MSIHLGLLLSCSSVLALSGTATAQDQGAAQAGEETATVDIIVTGSRVAANGNDQPTPVTVVAVEQMEDVAPTTVAEQLNLLPQFSGSQGQNTQAASGSANAGNPNFNGSVLNLRNFGFTRNLILYDNHRVAPNSPNGTIDVDQLPQLLLKRVDVVTGGASAVYGADAVTGVVNFVTDTTFNGLKAHAQAGISSRGDGGQKDLGIAGGAQIGDRLHVLASYQYRKDDGIDRRSSREYGQTRYQIGNVSTVPASGTTGVITTQQLVTLAGRPGASFGGTIATIGTPANPFNNFFFAAPGVLAPVQGTGPVTGTPAGNNFVNTNVAGNSTGSYFDPSLRSSLESHQLFGRLDFELTDGISLYARGYYNNSEGTAYGISNPTYQASNASNVHAVFANNPYLPANIRNTLAGLGITRFGLNRVFGGDQNAGLRQFTVSRGENWSADAGIQGNLGDWKWELAFLYTKNNLEVTQQNAINGRKLAAALDAVTPAAGGSPVCYVNTVLSTLPSAVQGLYQGCVPLANIFGGQLTQAESDYIFDPLSVTINTTQKDFEGYISGSPFSTWAGPVNVALSAQARKLSYEVISSTTPATLANPLDCSGLRLITCSATSLEYFQAESLSAPKRSVSVKEGAIEVNVPLLADSAIADKLSVSGAYRYTDYSTSGGVSSWKVGADWELTSELKFRGTRSRDIRAPTLHELFAPQSVGNFNGTDVLLGVALDGAAGRPAPAGNITSGNDQLRPEKANTFTVGAVYRPGWASGLSLAIDYFDINVTDAIVTLNGADVATQTDCISSGGASASCSLIVRPVNCCTNTTFANAITRAFARPINIGRQYTKGVDVELNYTKTLFGRPFQSRLLATYQPTNVTVDTLSGISANNAGAASPSVVNGIGAGAKWRGTFLVAMDVTDNLRVSILERYRSRLSWYPEYTGNRAPQFILNGAPATIPERWYTNVNLSFKTDPAEFFVNVQNLFDEKQAIYAGYQSALPGNNSGAPGDDPIGRYFTAGFRVKF